MKLIPVSLLMLLPTSLLAGERLPLRVLLLSNHKERSESFEKFLKPHFDKVVVTTHNDASWDMVGATDVVLLDWSQQEANSATAKSPLGPRGNWEKPTVLLGSAGHLLAAPWEVLGGPG